MLKLEGYFFSEPPTILCSMADVFVVVTVSSGVSLIDRRRHRFRPFHPIHLFKCTYHFSWSNGHVELFISRRGWVPLLFVALLIIVSIRVKTKISTSLPFRTAVCGSQVILLLISWLIRICGNHRISGETGCRQSLIHFKGMISTGVVLLKINMGPHV